MNDLTLDGPVHSNDVLDIGSGVELRSQLSTSRLGVAQDGTIGPMLAPSSQSEVLGGAPFGVHHREEIFLPVTIADVAQDSHITCRFRGPTLLRFDGPVVRVKSPRSVPRIDDPVQGSGAIGCMGVDRSLLVSPTAILLPPRAAIEVVRDTATDCVLHPLGIDLGEDAERDWWCSDGDAFVWGSYQGARTVLAEDLIQVVWDLVPTNEPSDADISGDVLGLLAGDSIVLRRLVARPGRRDPPYGRNVAFAGPNIAPFGSYPNDAPTPSASTWDSPVIVGSLVALRGSVGVQNPLLGEVHPGHVLVHGSLAARFRGLFAWEHRSETGALRGAMGYPLVLRYDPALIDRTPPSMPLIDGGAVRILRLVTAP